MDRVSVNSGVLHWMNKLSVYQRLSPTTFHPTTKNRFVSTSLLRFIPGRLDRDEYLTDSQRLTYIMAKRFEAKNQVLSPSMPSDLVRLPRQTASEKAIAMEEEMNSYIRPIIKLMIDEQCAQRDASKSAASVQKSSSSSSSSDDEDISFDISEAFHIAAEMKLSSQQQQSANTKCLHTHSDLDSSPTGHSPLKKRTKPAEKMRTPDSRYSLNENRDMEPPVLERQAEHLFRTDQRIEPVLEYELGVTELTPNKFVASMSADDIQDIGDDASFHKTLADLFPEQVNTSAGLYYIPHVFNTPTSKTPSMHDHLRNKGSPQAHVNQFFYSLPSTILHAYTNHQIIPECVARVCKSPQMQSLFGQELSDQERRIIHDKAGILHRMCPIWTKHQLCEPSANLRTGLSWNTFKTSSARVLYVDANSRSDFVGFSLTATLGLWLIRGYVLMEIQH